MHVKFYCANKSRGTLRFKRPLKILPATVAKNGIGLLMNAVEAEIANAFCVFLNTIQFGKTTLRGRSFIINDFCSNVTNIFT